LIYQLDHVILDEIVFVVSSLISKYSNTIQRVSQLGNMYEENDFEMISHYNAYFVYGHGQQSLTTRIVNIAAPCDSTTYYIVSHNAPVH